MCKIGKFLTVCSLLFVSCLIATQDGHSQNSNTWSVTGPMIQARAGASAVLLANGKVLITGGSDSTGVPQASAELFDPGTGQFAAAAPMNVPRANHAAITLYTGDVLVTGGSTTGGGYTDTAEIFSVQTGSWTLIEASLGTGLSKHVMASLSDGNVMIIGGQSTTGPVLDLLLFKLSDQTITRVGTLMTGRANAAAATTPDGRVLIAGGTDINGTVLGSTEIFTYSPETMSGTNAAGPNLTYPRTNATATTTYDGVAIIGGSNGNADLGSAEIFSQWTNAFRIVNGATPRSGHIATLLSKNGSILAMGGTGGTAVDLLQPWQNNLAGAFIPGAPSTMNHAEGLVAPGILGTMLAAGGTGSAGSAAELYWFPTISTDQPDYAPGTPVVMTGVGFQPGETVNLYLREYVNQMLVDPPDYSTTADSTGTFTFMNYAPTPSDLGARYHLTAVGQTSGFQAQTIFTDNYPKNKLTIAVSPAGGSPLANNVVAGGNSGASDYIGACITTSGCQNGNTIGQNLTVYVTATAGTGRLFSSWSVSGAPTGSTCANSYTGNPCTLATGNGSNTTTVTANFILTIPVTATLSANNKVYDGSTTEPDGNMSCTLNGVRTGDTVTCTATLGSFASANAGSGITVAATVTLGGADAAKYTLGAAGTTVSSTTATATASITPAAATVSVTPYSVTYDGSAHTATGTATGLNGTDLKANLNLSGTTHTNAGSYSTDSWLFHDPSGNYADANGTVNDSINKANATVTVTPYTVTYDGQAHTAVVASITGVNNETGSTVGTVDVSHTTHTGASTYSSDYWTFTGTANYSNISSTTITDTINKANAAVIVTPYTATYDGLAHTAVVASVNGVNSETGSTVGTVDLSHTTHTNASTYSSDYWTFAGSANYNDIANTTITDTINKANATVAVTPYTVTYDGQLHSATGTISGVNGETGATIGIVNLSNTSHTNAATYSTDSWSFTGSANYNDIASTTITDTINKANATVVVAPYTVTYDGQAHTAAVNSITGVNNESGGTVGTVDISNTSHKNAGIYSDSWTFTGTANYNNISSTTITDIINKANASVSVAPYTVTYDGHPHTASVTSIAGVNGETGSTVGTVNLDGTSHTNAGTYSDSWSFAGTANYNDIASTSITDTINKANASVVVAPYTVIYDGQPHTASATITGVNGETGTTVGTVNLNTTHTNAGTYSNDSWSFAGAANYNDIATTAVTDTISKADAKVTVTPYTVTYDGQAHTASVTSIIGVNGESGLTVGTVTLSTTHTSAGTYSTDSWSFSGTANYNSIAATAITDVINKANATVVVTPYSVTYDGQAHTAASMITGVNGETGATVGTVSLNATHTNAGTYSDSWSFTGGPNYNDIAATTITDTISKADPKVTVTPYTVTYDGQAHTAAVSPITGVNGETGATVGTVNLSTTHTNAGTYSDNWSFTGGPNYNDIAATTITDTISKADAKLTVTPYSVTYDGQAHTAAVSPITGVNGETGATVGTVNLGTTHTNAGTYSDNWSFTGGPNYNNIASTSITDVISKADPKISVSGYTATYDGNSHTATGAATGVQHEPLAGLDLSGTAHTNAGAYTDSWTFTDSTGNYNNDSGSVSDLINKADAIINVIPYSVTYDGNVHTATGTAKGAQQEPLAGLNLGGTSHTSAGVYNDTWSFIDSTGNYNNATGSVADTISKANANVSVTPYNVTYDGSVHIATGSVTGVGGTVLSGLDLTGTSHTNAGSYSDNWSFTDTTGNYNNATGLVNDVVSKANATVNVTPYKLTYDGSSHSATGSVTGVGGIALTGLDLSGTAHSSAGTYADTWTFSDSAGNYNSASGALSDVILQATAIISVTPYSVTYDTNAHTASATATGVGGVDLGADLNLTGTTHTNAGNYSTDPWTFHDPSGNYADAGGTVSDLIQKANQASLTLNAATPLVFNQNEMLGATGGTTNLGITYNLVSGSCGIAANLLTANSGTGVCVVTATMAGNNNYNDVTSGQVTVTLAKANQAALTLNAASPLAYSHSETLSTSGGTTSGTPTYSLVSGSCSVAGSILTANSGTGSCVLAATIAGNSNYNDVNSNQVAVNLAKANVTVAFNNVGPFTFDGGQHAPGYVVNGVNQEVLTSSAIASYNGTSGTTYSGATPPSNPGSYVETVAFAGNTNYNPLNPSVTQAFAITYGFSGLGAPYAPPPTTFNVTRTMPLVWQYTSASGAAVNSAGANPQVQISGPYTCGGVDNANDITVNSAGASGYQYNSTTSTWQFNWQVKGNAPGCYNIYIVSGQTGQMSGPYPIQVVSH